MSEVSGVGSADNERCSRQVVGRAQCNIFGLNSGQTRVGQVQKTLNSYHPWHRVNSRRCTRAAMSCKGGADSGKKGGASNRFDQWSNDRWMGQCTWWMWVWGDAPRPPG